MPIRQATASPFQSAVATMSGATTEQPEHASNRGQSQGQGATATGGPQAIAPPGQAPVLPLGASAATKSTAGNAQMAAAALGIKSTAPLGAVQAKPGSNLPPGVGFKPPTTGTWTPPATTPGAVGGAGAGGGGETTEAPKSELDKLYEDMLGRANSQWQVTEDLNMRSMAMMQRKAAAMQGTMGRSVAGGFAGAMGGAYIGGMNELNQARAQHEQALNALQLEYLKNKQAQMDRDEDQALSREQFEYQKGLDAGAIGAADSIAKDDPQGYQAAVEYVTSHYEDYQSKYDPNWDNPQWYIQAAADYYAEHHVGS